VVGCAACGDDESKTRRDTEAPQEQLRRPVVGGRFSEDQNPQLCCGGWNTATASLTDLAKENPRFRGGFSDYSKPRAFMLWSMLAAYPM
jgi:hypothetical protein